MKTLIMLFLSGVSLMGTAKVIGTEEKHDVFHSVSKGSVLLNEINYSTDESGFKLNYLEYINLNTENIQLEAYTIKIYLDRAEQRFNIPSEIALINSGYLLIDFGSSLQIPLPDLYFDEINFKNTLQISFGYYYHENTFILTDTAIFSNNGEGFPLTKTGKNISIQRKDDYGTPINTGDNKNDFEYFYIGTPTNSALGIAHYIMAETISGQAKYKYPIAKAMISSLTEPQKNFFKTDDSQYMKDTRKRYINWANSERDYDPYNDGLRPPAEPISKKTVALFIGAFVLLVGGGIFVIKRKNSI